MGTLSSNVVPVTVYCPGHAAHPQPSTSAPSMTASTAVVSSITGPAVASVAQPVLTAPIYQGWFMSSPHLHTNNITMARTYTTVPVRLLSSTYQQYHHGKDLHYSTGKTVIIYIPTISPWQGLTKLLSLTLRYR